jgi:tetratricopeptide (TPR) repeat protein
MAKIPRRRALAAAAFMLTLAAGPAVADDLDTCQKTPGDAAIAACTRAIASGAYTGHALSALYDNRGIRYAKKGEADRAIADYSEAIRLDPRNATAYYNRGKVWRAKGDYDRAIADAGEAIKLTPNDADAWNNRCYARALANRELPAALADCNQALQLSPSDVGTLDTRGLVYLRLGRFDAAIADYDAVLKRYPTVPESLYGRGLAKRKRGDAAGGDADIAAARSAKADIAETFARFGVR